MSIIKLCHLSAGQAIELQASLWAAQRLIIGGEVR